MIYPRACGGYLFSRAPALPGGSFEEKRPIANEDEPQMDTNEHEIDKKTDGPASTTGGAKMLLQFCALVVTMSWDDDFLPLGGYLFSLGVFLRGPSRTPFRVFSNPLESLRGPPSRPLAEPSRASSNPLVALRRSSWPFVDIFFGRSSLVSQLVSKKRRSGTRRLSKTTLSTYSAAKPLRLCHTAGQMPAGLPRAHGDSLFGAWQARLNGSESCSFAMGDWRGIRGAAGER